MRGDDDLHGLQIGIIRCEKYRYPSGRLPRWFRRAVSADLTRLLMPSSISAILGTRKILIERLLSQLFEELKRRNVFRVVIAYLAAGWLVLQVVQLVLESTSAPDWVMQVFLLAVAVGFPFAVLLAWAYELTPEGIKREKEVDRDNSITEQTGRKLNRTIIIVLAAAVALLLFDKFALQTDSAPGVATTDKSVAVLPFVAMSSGPDDEYFADGLTEEILNSLTRVPRYWSLRGPRHFISKVRIFRSRKLPQRWASHTS